MKGNKLLKGLLSSVLALAMAATLSTPVKAAEAYKVSADIRSLAVVPADLSGKTVIVHTNDMHGAISKYAYVASVKQNLQARGAEVILADFA